MNKLIIILAAISGALIVRAQGGSDASVISKGDRSVEQAYRIRIRPQAIDTLMPTPNVNYPLLVVREETSFDVEAIEPAAIRHRPQLSQLYRGFAKIGGGSRLMGLGEVYYNSLRSRKHHWGFHGQHLSEWGQLADVAPSMYDRSQIKHLAVSKKDAIRTVEN